MLKKMVRLAVALTIFLTIAACSSTTITTTSTNGNGASPTETNDQTAAGYNVQLGIGYLQQGDVQLAKSKLLKALEQAPNWAPAYDAMAYFLDNTGDVAGAEKNYKIAISLDPNSGSTQNNYGVFLCRQKRFQEADSHFIAAVKNPTYLNVAEAYENAGLCAMQASNTTLAITDLQNAVAQDPRRSTSYLALSQILYNQGNFPEAQQYFDRYTAQTPNMGADGLWLGIRLARHLNDTATAGRYALMLQNKYPHSSEYQQLMLAKRATKNNTDKN